MNFRPWTPYLEPVSFFALWAATNVVNLGLYYLQNVNRLVYAVWFEPETFSVCIELYNWFKLFNLENNAFGTNNDITRVIKIPYKFLSPDKYGPEKRSDSVYQFDFCHVSKPILKLNRPAGTLINLSRWHALGLITSTR